MLLHSGRARSLRRGIDADLPGRGLGIADLPGPAIQRLGIIPFRGRRRRNLIGVLQAIEGKGFDQLRFPGSAAIGCVHGGQMPRAAERQYDSNQGGNEARPKVMSLLASRRGNDGGLRDAPHSQAGESPNWRRRMGIEPTWNFVEPHHGFEDQERHQVALRLRENEARGSRMPPRESSSTFNTRVTSGTVINNCPAISI
jgi:hypothetical protein